MFLFSVNTLKAGVGFWGVNLFVNLFFEHKNWNSVYVKWHLFIVLFHMQKFISCNLKHKTEEGIFQWRSIYLFIFPVFLEKKTKQTKEKPPSKIK